MFLFYYSFLLFRHILKCTFLTINFETFETLRSRDIINSTLGHILHLHKQIMIS